MAKGVTGPRNSVQRPSSRGNQQKLPSSFAKQQHLNVEDEENHDQVTSLDSFRAASRQGSCDGALTDTESTDFTDLPPKTKSSRQSLSDRTMGSIQNLPATPKERRRSSFFSPADSPMGPPPRPSSSSSRNGSRPGTSDGNFANPSIPSAANVKATASAKPASRTSLGRFGMNGISNVTFESALHGKPSVPASPKSPSVPAEDIPATLPKESQTNSRASKSRTVAASKSAKPRPSLADASRTAVRSGAIQDGQSDDPALRTAYGTMKPSPRTVSNPTNSSSAALRQQIAAAKAAARKEKAKQESSRDASLLNGNSLDFDVHSDPFNQAPKDGKHILRNRINAARMDGRLNIAALGIKDIPEEVLTMYDAAAMEESRVSWAEVVDLTKLIAGDNEIEELGDNVFPDRSAEDLAEDDDVAGNQFGGLDTLDVHGNKLLSVPMGLRRLERLTSLNLAYNKLENNTLEIFSQIPSLKGLKLGHNAFSGNLSPAICGLRNLETLEIQGNRLLGLPAGLRELTSLRILNVSENQLNGLPMDELEDVPLTELYASSNALKGSLFSQPGRNGHRSLQTLKVANNAMSSLASSQTLTLPQLRELDVTNNKLTALPSVDGWSSLITLIAGDNKITDFPVGFTSLHTLRNVNLTSNEIKILDPEIAKMESLDSLILASNPLRDKKYLTMNAADIKRDLKTRLGATTADRGDLNDQEEFHDARDTFSRPSSSSHSTWNLQAGGKLDLSAKELTDEANDALGSFLKSNEVRILNLASNKLTSIPPALWLGQDLKVLDLSGNTLGSDYLSDELSLPSLQELSLSRCSLTTLDPLIAHLEAPRLESLNVTINRLTGDVPPLRSFYPALTTFLAADNKFTTLTAESVRGLHTVNLSSNSIEALPAELGLLWDEGLRNLEVGSNAFRVPNYRVLEKGTEATLRYLRDKLPAKDAVVVNGDTKMNDEVV